MAKWGVNLDFTGNFEQFMSRMTSSFTTANQKILREAAKTKNPAAAVERRLESLGGAGLGQIAVASNAGLLSPSERRRAEKAYNDALTKAARDLTRELGLPRAQRIRPPDGLSSERATLAYKDELFRAKQTAQQAKDADAARIRAERQATTERARSEKDAEAARSAQEADDRRRAPGGPNEDPVEKNRREAREQLERDQEAIRKRMYGLTGPQLDIYRTRMGSREGPAAAGRAGQGSSLDRLYGLWTGVAEELAAINTVLPGVNRTIADLSKESRAYLDSLQRQRRQQEGIASERRRLADMRGPQADDYRELSGVRRERQLVERGLYREGTSGLLIPEGQDVAAERRRRTQVNLEAERARTPEDVVAASELARAKRAAAVAERTRTSQSDLADRATLAAEGELKAAKVEETRATKRAAAQALRDRGFGSAEGTFTQRVQKRIADRTGQIPRNADEFLTGRQLISSRLLTTASFAASGGLLYGALGLGSNILQESTELQQELGIIRTQFKLVEQSASDVNNVTFDQFRQQIRDTARETGVQQNEVANVQRQLAGAFATPEGTPNFGRAASEGNVALKYSRISPLSQQEITDSLSAVSLAFREGDVPLGFEEILDTITDLENRFGVLGPEIVKFTADLAPLGKELGFTQKQLSGLGAVAQQKSGKSGAVLAEQLGRILPSLQEKSAELFELFDATPATQGIAASLAQAFDTGNTPEALKQIILGYDQLDDAQKKYLASLVGGRREAATFYALLDSPTQTVRVLDDQSSSAGKFQERWQQNTKTVVYSFDRMQRSVEQFGNKVFESGVDDWLKGLADLATVAGVGLSGLVDILGSLNSVTGGWVPRLLAAAGALAVISRLNTRVGGVSGVMAFLSNGAITQGVSARAAGGILSPVRPGAPILNDAGSITGYDPDVMRRSTLRAQNTPGLNRLLTRQGGVVTAGLGTGLASGIAAAGPAIAATLTAAVISDIVAYQGQAKQARKDLGEKIQAGLKEGLSASQIRAKLAKSYSNNRDSVRDSFYEGIFGATDLDKTIAEEQARIQSEATVRQIEELGKVTGNYKPTGKPTQLNKGTRAAVAAAFKAARDADDAKVVEILAKTGGLTAEVGPGADWRTEEVFTGELEAVVSPQVLEALAKYKKDNPSSVAVDRLLKSIRAQLPPELQKRFEDIFDDLNKDKPDTAAQQLDKIVQDFATFETKLERAKGAYAAGRSSLLPILATLNEKRKSLKRRMAEAVQSKNAKAMAEIDAELDGINSLYSENLTADISARGAFRDSLQEALGTGGDQAKSAGQGEANARADYNRLKEFAFATAEDKAAAAVKLIQAQRENLDAQIEAAAGNPAEIARLTAQKLQVGRDVQRDVIGGQLTSGKEAVTVEAVAKTFKISQEAAAALVADTILTTDSMTTSILDAELARQQKILETAIERISNSPYRGNAKAGLASLQSQLDTVLRAREGLPELDTSVIVPDSISGTNPNDKTDPSEIARLNRELAAARVAQDPVASANLAVSNARAARAEAEAAGDDAAVLQARIEEVQAMQQQREAQQSIDAAYGELLAARLSRDPQALAAQNVRNAAAAVGRANGQAERLQALAAQITAQRALEDAVFAMFEAQMDVANAMSESIGDVVAVANREAQVAQAALDRARQNGTGGSELQSLLASAIRANTNAVEVARADRIGDLDYLYEFDRITAGQYINLLQAELEKIPEANKNARREIERKIKAVRDEMSQDLALNIPSEIKLPTLYEARRLNQIATDTPGGSYTDARNIQIIVNEAEDGGATMDRALAAIGTGSRRNGSAPPSTRSRF